MRTRRWTFRIVAMVLGLLLALGLTEGALRLGKAPPEPVKVEPVAADSISNPLGLRDRWDEVPLHPDVLRVAFLGDSFTYGLGVEPEQTFVRRVRFLLRERWPRPCVTVNLGRPGVDLISGWAVLNQVRDDILPHVVVHVMSQDDLDVDLYQEPEAIEHFVLDRSWPARHSRLFNMLETSVRLSRATPLIIDSMRGGTTPQLRERAWKIASYQIASCKRLAEERGGVYVLVRFPCLRWVARPAYPLEDVHRRFAQVAAGLQIPYLDLLDTFRGRPADQMCLTSIDDHPTPAAHQMAAEAIADFLVRAVLPKVHAGPTTGPTNRRTPPEAQAAEIRQYEEILRLDPTCRSARFWLDQARRRCEGR